MKHGCVALVIVLLGGHLLANPRSSPTEITGDLSVVSDPRDADVYIDGRLAGRTPIALTRLPPGDHRLRLVKAGYLENARLIRVAVERPANLRVTLTRQPTPSATAGQVEIARGEGLERHAKWPWVVLGAATAGVGGYLATKSSAAGPAGSPSGGTTPPNTPPNNPPVAGAVGASPSTGLAASTAINLSAIGASDPDGDPLTFDWDFGDGSHGTGLNTNHVYNAPGPFLVTVTVSDGKASVSASGAVTIKSLTGTWTGPLVSGATTLNTTVVLNQSGASLSGTYSDGTLTNGTVAGFVATSSPTITFTVTGLVTQFTFTGNPSASIDALTGFANGGGFTNAPWTLTRQ